MDLYRDMSYEELMREIERLESSTMPVSLPVRMACAVELIESVLIQSMRAGWNVIKWCINIVWDIIRHTGEKQVTTGVIAVFSVVLLAIVTQFSPVLAGFMLFLIFLSLKNRYKE